VTKQLIGSGCRLG